MATIARVFAPVLHRVAGTVHRRLTSRSLLLVIVSVAFVLRFAGAGYGLPAEFRPDEIYVVNRSLGILVHQYDSTFFFWPSLYYWLIAPIYLVMMGIGGLLGLHTWGPTSGVTRAVSDPSPYIFAIRVIGVGCGALLPVPLYLIGRRLRDELVGLLAALIGAIAFLSVRESHFGLQDGPAVLAVAFALYAAVRAYLQPPRRTWLNERGAMRWWVLAGVLAGVAFALKYHPGLVIAPILVLAVRRGWFPAVLAAAPAAAAGTLLQPELFIRTNDVITGLLSHPVQGEDSVRYYVQYLLPAGLGLLLMALVVLGSVRGAVERRLIVVALALHAALVLLVLGRGTGGYGRYMLPLLPAASVLGAFGADWVRALFRAPRVRAPASIAAVVAVCGALLPMLITDVSFDRISSDVDTRTVAYEWARARIPPGATVATSYFGGIFHSASWAADFNPTGYAGIARAIVDNRVGPWREVWMDDQTQVQIAASLRPSDVDYIVLSSPYPQQRFAMRVTPPRGFHVVFHIQPLDQTAQPQYDRFDGLYIPIADFSGVRAPGPEIYVFKSDY